MTWQLPLVALHVSGILDALERAPVPNQGGYAAPETAMQFEAARTAAQTLLAGGHLGVEGIFTVRLSGSAQPEHGAADDRPLEEIVIEIARHASMAPREYHAGPVTVRLGGASISEALASAPLETVRIEIARHQPRSGGSRRSY